MADKRSMLSAVLDKVLGDGSTRLPVMDPVKLLKQQHRMVDMLFARIMSSSGRNKQTAWDELLTSLAIHAELEEQIFYPMLKREGEEKLLEAVEEHLAVKRILADLIDLDVSDPIFDAKITVLKEMVRHHVREEESELMPLASRMLDAEAQEAVLEEMIALEMELREGGDLEQAVIDGTDEASPI